MTIKKICALTLLALLAACDIAGQPCGLLNESACSTTPTVPPPTCGAIIPTPGTTLWQCNLPASASDAPDNIGGSPCSLLFCERVTELETGVTQEAAMCCRPPVATFDMVCSQGVDDPSGQCCVPTLPGPRARRREKGFAASEGS